MKPLHLSLSLSLALIAAAGCKPDASAGAPGVTPGEASAVTFRNLRELALGRGTCPHHGEQVAAVRSTTSPLVAHYTAPAGQTAPKGQWFAHVRLMNADKMLGKETAFRIKAFVLK